MERLAFVLTREEAEAALELVTNCSQLNRTESDTVKQVDFDQVGGDQEERSP